MSMLTRVTRVLSMTEANIIEWRDNVAALVHLDLIGAAQYRNQ